MPARKIRSCCLKLFWPLLYSEFLICFTVVEGSSAVNRVSSGIADSLIPGQTYICLSLRCIGKRYLSLCIHFPPLFYSSCSCMFSAMCTTAQHRDVSNDDQRYVQEPGRAFGQAMDGLEGAQGEQGAMSWQHIIGPPGSRNAARSVKRPKVHRPR